MNDIDKELEIKELTDKIHTHKLKNDIVLFIKYLLLSVSLLLMFYLITSIFRY